MRGSPVAGGGRRVRVAPERLERWLDGFAERHGEATATALDGGAGVRLTAADGAVAEVAPAFPPVPATTIDGVLAHALLERRVGVLLVRLGGHAAGVFHGRELVASKVGSRQVHGRSAAGGWSQQRFARRRENQVASAHSAAWELAARVLGDHELDAVVTGGERSSVEAVLADRRLAPLRSLVAPRFLTVPDPRHVVLVESIDAALAVEIVLRDA